MNAKQTSPTQDGSESASALQDEVLMEKVASAHGFELFRHYSEPESSKLLSLHPSTLKRARADHSIGFIRKGTKSIAYFGFHLAEYLLSNSTCAQTRNGSIN